MLAPEELERFCQLLQALLSGDNQRRKESEHLYQATKQVDPDRLCKCLVTVLTQGQDETLRQQSAILLRQCLKDTRADFVWPQLPQNTQLIIKAQLLGALRSEQTRSTKHKVCDAVSMLACHLLDPSSSLAEGGWPDLGPALSELLEASDSSHRESALRVVKDMIAVNPPVAYALVQGNIGQVMRACHCDDSIHVRKECVLLFCAICEHLPIASSKPHFDLLLPTLGVVQQLESHEYDFQECLEAFVQVAEFAPNVFQSSLASVFPMMFTIGRAKDRLGDGVRQTACEFILTLCTQRPKLCGKVPGFIPEVVQLCLEFMLEVEEEENWAEMTDKDEDSMTNYDVGSENIDRVARAYVPSGRTNGSAENVVIEEILTVVKNFVKFNSWRHKYVAVMTLSQSVEVISDETYIENIIQLLVSLVVDPYPRVRHAALHAIGQMSSDHSPHIQDEYHELLLPALLRAMDDPVTRVAAHACAAFINFAEDLDIEYLLPHVPGLMEKLASKVMSQSQLLMEQSITAVAVVAAVIKTHFVPYYQHIMPVLKQIVLTAEKPEERALRGKAFECMSLLGHAVGRELFRQDAHEAMQAMMEIASRSAASDDPQRSYIHEAAMRICRDLKEDFMPYLPYLLPGIYATLQIQPSELLDPDAEEEQDMSIALLQDGKALGLRTAQIEEIRSAVQMLGTFLDALGGHYFDHLQDTARCLLPIVNFRFSDDIKKEAVMTWHELLEAAKKGIVLRQISDTSLVSELLRHFVRGTLEAMGTEEDLELLMVETSGLCDCIQSAGPGIMNSDEVGTLCVALRGLIDQSLQRQHAPKQEDWNEDEEAEAEQLRDLNQLLRVKYVDLVGVLMATYKQEFLQIGAQQFAPVMQQCLMTEGAQVPDRYIGLYLLSVCFDKLGTEGAQMWQPFIRQMLLSLQNDDAWIRAAAAYGVLHAARLPEFAQFAAGAAGMLGAAVCHPAAWTNGNIEATEAAVAALGFLCRYQKHSIDVGKYLPQFIKNLPLQHELDQAGPAHEVLMSFVEEDHPVLQSQASAVCKIFLEVYNRDWSTDSLNAGIRRFFSKLSVDNIRQMHPPLSEKHKNRIKKIAKEAKAS